MSISLLLCLPSKLNGAPLLMAWTPFWNTEAKLPSGSLYRSPGPKKTAPVPVWGPGPIYDVIFNVFLPCIWLLFGNGLCGIALLNPWFPPPLPGSLGGG